MYHSLKWCIELWLGSLMSPFFFLIGRVIACSVVGSAGTKTHWHWTVNLPPQAGHLQEEESSAGLFRTKTRWHLHLGGSFLGCGVGTGRTRACNGMSCLWESLSWGTAELLRHLTSMFLVGPFQLNYSESSSVFTIHHPEPQSFACSSQGSSYEALCDPRSCATPSPHRVWEVWKASKKTAKKAGKGGAGESAEMSKDPSQAGGATEALLS